VKDLESLVERTLADIGRSGDLAALDSVRVGALGKKGSGTGLLKGLGSLPAGERRQAGAAINDAKDRIAAALDARRGELEAAVLDRELKSAAIDVTLPGRGQSVGRLPPVTRPRLPIEAIFPRSGFADPEGPEGRGSGAAGAPAAPVPSPGPPFPSISRASASGPRTSTVCAGPSV